MEDNSETKAKKQGRQSFKVPDARTFNCEFTNMMLIQSGLAQLTQEIAALSKEIADLDKAHNSNEHQSTTVISTLVLACT